MPPESDAWRIGIASAPGCLPGRDVGRRDAVRFRPPRATGSDTIATGFRTAVEVKRVAVRSDRTDQGFAAMIPIAAGVIQAG